MAEKLVWVGPRESDILFSDIDYYYSVTFNGSNIETNISFTSCVNTRINHNSAKEWNLGSYLKEQICMLAKDPNVRFVFYNPIQAYSFGTDVVARTNYLNSYELLDFLRNKALVRSFVQNHIPVVPYVAFSGRSLPVVSFDVGKPNMYVLQKVHSSGGNGTLSLKWDACVEYVQQGSAVEEYILSPYLENAAPINVHAVIFDDECIVLPCSYQLIRHNGQSFSYIGGDFHTALSSIQYDLIKKRTLALAEELRLLGYRGVCGFDYMLTEDELFFLEINPRFQASSFLLDMLLAREGKPTLHQLNLYAFTGKNSSLDSFSTFEDPKSFFTVYGESVPGWYTSSPMSFPQIICEMVMDGFLPTMERRADAYLFRAITTRNLCWLNQDFKLQIAPNILQDSDDWKKKVLEHDSLTIKISLLNQGIRLSSDAIGQLETTGSSVRQGVFQSIDLFLSCGLIVNAPYHTDFSSLSPYSIEWHNREFYLYYNDHCLCTVNFDVSDPYRDYIASGGTKFRNVTFWATDRLRVHHQFRCRFKEAGIGCKFCNVRLKEGRFSIEDVCEAIDFYLDNADFRHFLIGGGSGTPEREYKNILFLTKHIRSRCEKSIYAMCLPPDNPLILEEYFNAGINEIGFNMEIFDREVARKMMPGKGNISLSQYEKAYRAAVKLWGKNGNVRSLLVLGLEKIDSFYAGVDWLCSLGVMPIISVFRPLNNIQLLDVLPPENEDLAQIYNNVVSIAAQYGLFPGPSCIACQNNTLSLPIA